MWGPRKDLVPKVDCTWRTLIDFRPFFGRAATTTRRINLSVYVYSERNSYCFIWHKKKSDYLLLLLRLVHHYVVCKKNRFKNRAHIGTYWHTVGIFKGLFVDSLWRHYYLMTGVDVTKHLELRVFAPFSYFSAFPEVKNTFADTEIGKNIPNSIIFFQRPFTSCNNWCY